MSEPSTIFQCPVCSGALERSEEALSCGGCNRRYPIRDGIADFRIGRYDYYFNPVPRNEMRELVANMTAETWPHSIRRFIAALRNNVSWLDNLIVDGRYAWKIFLNLDKQGVVMDLGCGLGNLASNLATHARKTYAMDLTFERLEFSQKRFSIFNRGDDIELVAGGDAALLPFADKSLDCVTLSGVLEWVGEGDLSPFYQGGVIVRLWRMLAYQFGRRSPRSIQLQFLKEIRRVLKDDGQLFIGIENRLNFAYLFDRPDHHSGLKWGSLLPRHLANLYSIWRKHVPYRTYTYSIYGYRRLLRQAGFGRIEFFSLREGYTNLREITPADAEIANWRGAMPAPRTIGQRLRRYRHFVPAYGIIANVQNTTRERLYDRLLTAVSSTAGFGATAPLAIDAARISEKEKLLLAGSAGDTPIMVKLPLNRAAQESEQTNHDILTELTAGEECCDFLPRPLAAGEVDGLPFFVERKVPGAAMSALVSGWEDTRALRLADDALRAIDAAHPPTLKPLDGELYDRCVSDRIAEISTYIDEPELLRGINAYFRETLHGIPVSVGVQHGDFSLSNIFVSGDRVSGVIDWEAGSTDGLPILDPINFVVSLDRGQKPDSRPVDRWSHVASIFDSAGDEAAFLDRCYQRHGMNKAHHRALVHLHWLQVATLRLKFGMGCNPLELDSFFYDVANTLPATPSNEQKVGTKAMQAAV